MYWVQWLITTLLAVISLILQAIDISKDKQRRKPNRDKTKASSTPGCKKF